ncbi:glycosyltransferase [Paenibacillus radicis (ex Gao et al. 2016)]|uniref:4,4'-diaponeurosporenoate glycosyltransferase n=1 Tax=Paenibacillus radicis (ex Gao et al. 2016) TaxID=1737354 RepID=A0A917LZB6_9BACL|nr:glycosyltransferase [Paenibacillus radicis (ex Gao et al. 2016)]GGG68867.1 4,4'-diaponeurosporenoate glycosyltransferase [Paenibacillus radicis (ex Gao et al. 2016)]
MKHMKELDASRLTGRINKSGGTNKRSGFNLAVSLPSVSVIIPARNEAFNLGALLHSLAVQDYRALEVIVVDDGSEDNTAEIALQAGARVITPGPLPLGWFGKSWACWNGANHANGELLVFIDADAILDSRALGRLAAVYRSEADSGLLTVQPYHRMIKSYEKLSAFCNLVVLASIHANDGRAGGFGPCVVCTKEAYFQAGGHRIVSGKVLENHALAQRFQAMGMPVHNYGGKGLISFRMYPDGIRSFLAGWCKSFSSGAAATPPLRLTVIALWIAGAVSAVLLWFKVASYLEAIIAAAIYLAYAIQLYLLLRRAGSFGLATAIWFPLPLLVFLYIFIRSWVQTFVGGRVQWKGRTLSTKKERSRL